MPNITVCDNFSQLRLFPVLNVAKEYLYLRYTHLLSSVCIEVCESWWCLVVLAQKSETLGSIHLLHMYFASLFLVSSCCQVTEYYTQVQRSLEVDPCNVISKKHKDWPRLLNIKIHYFQAVSHVSCEAGANNLVSFPGCDGLGMRLG